RTLNCTVARGTSPLLPLRQSSLPCPTLRPAAVPPPEPKATAPSRSRPSSSQARSTQSNSARKSLLLQPNRPKPLATSNSLRTNRLTKKRVLALPPQPRARFFYLYPHL